MEHFGKFGVIYYDINQIITTAVMTLSKHFDTHGRIKEVQYEIFRSLMYWMTVQYDSMGTSGEEGAQDRGLMPTPLNTAMIMMETDSSAASR